MSEKLNFPDSGIPEMPELQRENFGEIFPTTASKQQAGDVISQLIHDARDPLQTFISLGELLKVILPAPQKNDIVPIVHRGVEHMESVLKNAGGTTPRSCRVSDVYQTLCMSLENGWMDSIRKKVPHRTNWKVILEPLSPDIERIQIISSESGWKGSILPNFVSNAVLANAQTIVIRFVVHNDYGVDALAVEIIDDGHGMSQEVIDKLLKGEWHSSGKTMRAGDSQSDHNHGFPSAKRIILGWGARLQIHSREATESQQGQTIMRIIFNGAKSKNEDFPDNPVVVKDTSSDPVPLDAIQEFINGPDDTRTKLLSAGFDLTDITFDPAPTEPERAMLAPEDLNEFMYGNKKDHSIMTRRAWVATTAAGIILAAGGTYMGLPKRKSLQQSLITSSDMQVEPEQQSFRPVSRIIYDQNGLVSAVEGNGWTWERGAQLSDIRVTELMGRDGHILAFESADPQNNPLPKIALSTVPGRTFGFIEHAGRVGYIVTTDAAGNAVDLGADSLMEFSDAVLSPRGPRACKLDMFSDNVLGTKNGPLEILARAEQRRKPQPGEYFAHSAATMLTIAMAIRDAQNAQRLLPESVDELLVALEKREPLLAVIPDALKEELRTKRLSKKLIGEARAPGLYLGFPSTNTAETQAYIDV